LSSQTNPLISGVVGILLKELRQGESGFSNLATRKVLYIGKPSFENKKFTQHKKFLKTKKNLKRENHKGMLSFIKKTIIFTIVSLITTIK
jgi:hypothetical protein